MIQHMLVSHITQARWKNKPERQLRAFEVGWQPFLLGASIDNVEPHVTRCIWCALSRHEIRRLMAPEINRNKLHRSNSHQLAVANTPHKRGTKPVRFSTENVELHGEAGYQTPLYEFMKTRMSRSTEGALNRDKWKNTVKRWNSNTHALRVDYRIQRTARKALQEATGFFIILVHCELVHCPVALPTLK